MSYNNTVRCSHCWNTGHNKSGCSVLREKMQARIAEDPNDWRATQYFANKKRSSKRTCSYCTNVGHNRKTCKELKFAKATTVRQAAEWREKALTYFKRIGLGVGSLVRYNNDAIGLITAVNWHAMDHRFLLKDYHEERVFQFSDVRNAKMTTNVTLPIPKDETHAVTKENYDPWYTIEVVGPVSEKAIGQQMPGDWLTGVNCIGAIFDKETSPYCVNDWVELQGFYKENQKNT